MTRTISSATLIIAFAGGCTGSDDGTGTQQPVVSPDPSAPAASPGTPVSSGGGSAAGSAGVPAASGGSGTSQPPSPPGTTPVQMAPPSPAAAGGTGGAGGVQSAVGGAPAAAGGTLAAAGGTQAAAGGTLAAAGGTQAAAGGTQAAAGGTQAAAGGAAGANPMLPAGLPPVAGKMLSPPATPLEVPDGSVQLCKTGDNWLTLVSQNSIGCAKACQSQGMNCRRSYHDSGCSPKAHPELPAPNKLELGCGQLAEQATDFCACSAETFFQGELYYEHPRTRVSPPLVTCQAGEGWATLVFDDKSGCNAACESVGLKCHSSAEDLELECGPQAGPGFKLDCNNTLGHASDYCVCTADGTAAGLPDSVVNPWKPF